MRLNLSLLILGLLFSLTPPAFAQDHNQNCKDAGDQASNECSAEGKGAEGANTGQASGIGSSMPGSQINIGAQGQKQSALDSANRLNAAKNDCQKKQDECKNKCDNEAQQADQDAQQAQAQDPQHQCNARCQNFKKQASDIRSKTKDSACIAPIAAMMKELGDGANNAQQAANGANNTQNSSGFPSIPPISPPSPSPTPAQTPTPAPTLTPDKMSQCSDPASATLASCTKTLVDTCTPGLASNEAANPTCDTFTMHYCNTTPSSGSTQFSGTTVPAQGQVRDGSGVGSSYCNTAIAKNFCQEPGRSQCATCQNYRNQNSDACKQNPASCQTTQFSASCPTTEPPIATTPPSGTTPVTGGGSTGSGGGGDLMSGGTAANGEKYSAASVGKEGVSPGLKMDMSTSGGSGGDGGYSPESDDFASKYRKALTALTGGKPAIKPASRAPASDVASGGGASPSLFYISSTTIQNMCTTNRLHHCGKLN